MESPLNYKIDYNFDTKQNLNFINKDFLLNNEDMIKLQDVKINNLENKIKNYENKNEENINQKDILNENEIEKLKDQNLKLIELIESRNKIILEYKKIIEASAEKFKLYNDSNLFLKNKVETDEFKLKLLPNLLQSNEELNNKLNSNKKKIEKLKKEINDKDDYYKKKINNIENNNKIKIEKDEKEISDLKKTIIQLNSDLESLKKK